MVDITNQSLEGRIVNLERTTAVHDVQIKNLYTVIERLSDNIAELSDAIFEFKDSCVGERGKATELSEKVKWIERGVLVMLASLIAAGLNATFM